MLWPEESNCPNESQSEESALDSVGIFIVDDFFLLFFGSVAVVVVVTASLSDAIDVGHAASIWIGLDVE